MSMHRQLLPLLLVACGPSNKGTESPRKPLTPKDIVQRSTPAIVRVEANGLEGEQYGTGFFVDKSGVVATSLHVVKGTQEVNIKLHDGTRIPVTAVLSI